MAKIFERALRKKVPYSSFDLSREQKLSCKMGDLIPTYLEEVVPGDQFMVKTETLVRLAPMLAPIMHRVDLYIHYFFVPNRIIWNQWETFITGGREGTAQPVYPTFALTNLIRDNFKLADYLGIPAYSTANNDLSISQLPFRAYQKIYNDYYRDPNLVAEIDVNTMSAGAAITIRKRSWEKDYFTSALATTQRGPEVGIPVDFDYLDVSEYYTATGAKPAVGTPVLQSWAVDNVAMEDTLSNPLRVENLDATSIDFTINELRKSSALQRFLETNMIGGYRYIEQILAHFGVRSKDERLQRAEYIGGGKQPIVISEVLNTTGTEEAPQGDMAGHGISVGTTNQFKYFVPEHGYIMGILSVLPKTAYQQGIPKHWLRRSRFDYYFPEFANLGEQPIQRLELYLDTVQSVDQNRATFGYQQRYAEYKYGISTVHGDFRTTLSFWHMGRIFATPPTLSAQFMEADPTTRIFAVTTGDHLWIQLYHDVKARRPMPYFADPRLS